LYTFIPRWATPRTSGIRSIARLSGPHRERALRKYEGRTTRAGYRSPEDYLLKTRGDWGLKTISCFPFIPPPPEQCSIPIRNFLGRRVMHYINYPFLLRDGKVERVILVGVGYKKRVDLPLLEVYETMSLWWPMANFTVVEGLLLRRVPHVLLVTHEGLIEPDYITRMVWGG